MHLPKPRSTILKFLITLTGAALCAGTVLAGTYRWVDENGVTVYSQIPPPDDRTVTRIKPPPPPPEKARAWEKLDFQWQEMQDRREAARKRQSRQQEQALIERQRQQNCQAAKRNLQLLQGPANKKILMPDGTYQRLPAEQRQERIEATRGKIREYCTTE